MGYSIITGTTGVYDPSGSYIDSGWVIAGGYAVHYPCNPGYMTYIPGFPVVVGKTYIIKYTLDEYVSGQVYPIAGATNGTSRTANGIYTDTLLCTTTGQIQFYSDGYLRISSLTVQDQAAAVIPGFTLAFFDGDKKKWGLQMSFETEMMCRFKSVLFVFKNGQVWQQASNDVHNNFFGVQYNSQIHIIANFNPKDEKIFYSMHIRSNRSWYAHDIGDLMIPPTEGKILGMQSRLRKNRINRLQGSYFGDFLRNMLDPRFMDQEVALFQGAELRGNLMEIILTNSDTIEVNLFEIDIKTSKSMYT